MNWKALIFLLLPLLAAPAFGDLIFTLDPAIESGMPGDTDPFGVVFDGTLTDTDMSGNLLFLNDIDVTFTPPADSYLSADPNFFFNNVPGVLDGTGNNADPSYTGPIFEVDIAPDTPPGAYGSPLTTDLTITILGGGDPSALNSLATQSFEVDVTPEPGVAGLTIAGLLGLGILNRRRRAKAC